jgi:transmembrane sensor
MDQLQNRFWSLLAKKLTNEANPVELQELRSILLNNSELQHRAEILTEMWQQQPMTGSSDSEAAYMRYVMKHKDDFFSEENSEAINNDGSSSQESPGLVKKRLTIFSFIALIVLTTGIVYFITQKGKPESPTQAISSIVTKNGNRTKILLPDGSQVWLNAGSNLDYNNSDFNKHLREVTLNGEAYFDVTKNAEKPFIIHTKKMDIKVIGTAFNVRSYSDEKVAEASLIRGSIEVTLKDRKNRKIILEPNEKISIATDDAEQAISNTGKTIAAKNTTQTILPFAIDELKPNPKAKIIAEIAWTQNKLYFEDENFENIALMLERWFGKKIVIQSEPLKKVRYTGNFENETMDAVLSYLKL